MDEKLLSDAEILESVSKAIRYSLPEMARELGYSSHSTLYHITAGRNKISEDLIDKIVKRWPQVNFWFLKKGKEPILLEKNSEQVQRNLFGSESEARGVDFTRIPAILEEILEVQHQQLAILKELLLATLKERRDRGV